VEGSFVSWEMNLQFGRNYPVFQRNLLPPSAYYTLMDAASSCEMMVHSIRQQGPTSQKTVLFISVLREPQILGRQWFTFSRPVLDTLVRFRVLTVVLVKKSL